MPLRFGSSGVTVVAMTFVAVFCLSTRSQGFVTRCQSSSTADVGVETSENKPAETGSSSSASKSKSGIDPELTESWPSAAELIADLESLSEHAKVRTLAAETRQQLQRLAECKSIGDESTSSVIASLSTNELRLKALAVGLSKAQYGTADPSTVDVQLPNELGRFCFDLHRQLAVWKRVNEIAQRSQRSVASSSINSKFHLTNSRRISFAQLNPSWTEYLKLNQVREAFEAMPADAEKRKASARQTLARIYSPALSQRQSEYLQQVFDLQVISHLKSQAVEEVNLQDLLTDLQRYETKPSGYNASKLNDHYQNLFWSSDPAKQVVAADLEAHYRNANFRVAVSEQLLNRLVPQLPATDEPFSERIQGAQVDGLNNISNQLYVQLVPDPNQVRIQLKTVGQIESNSVARRDGFTIRNLGHSQFHVSQQLAIGRGGISAERPIATSNTRQRLIGLNSKLDSIPVLGRVAKRVAKKKIREQQPQTDRILKDRIANDASMRMQQLVEAELIKVRTEGSKKLLQPLIKLDLEPEPIQMTSTDKQIIMRYRLAGRDQMAAHTARPQDDATSLLSLQLHESIINNALARIELNSNKFSIDELKTHLQDKLGLADKGDEPTGETEAEFEFSRFDPVRVDFKENRVLITMNLNSLKIADGSRWKRVTMTAAYIPQRSGMKLALIQDEQGTRIKGHRLRFRDRAAIGTVHKVVFKREYEFDTLPAKYAEKMGGSGLEVSQIVVSDGWAAISIDDANPKLQSGFEATAAANQATQNPTGNRRR